METLNNSIEIIATKRFIRQIGPNCRLLVEDIDPGVT
jgi:hypothetical protein